MTELIGAPEKRDVVLAEDDGLRDGWFARVAATIQDALGEQVLGLHHIGSTAVPGLLAKPVLDVLLLVADPEDEAYLAPLVEAGLVLRVREPHHRMLRTPERDVHLHVYAPGRPEVCDYLDLRDRLRVSPEERALYAATKQRLAAQDWPHLDAYAEAKSEVITAILGRGRPRPLRDDETDAVVALWEATGLTRPWNDPHDDLTLSRRSASSEVLVLPDLSGTVMVGFDGHRGWIYYLAVHPDQQGEGLGSVLVRAAEAWLRDRGAPKVQLMVRSDNPVAEFYRQQGYDEQAVTVLGRRLP